MTLIIALLAVAYALRRVVAAAVLDRVAHVFAMQFDLFLAVPLARSERGP